MNNKKTAFSIVEMSIVIAIIALLIAGIVVKKSDLITKAKVNRMISATQNSPLKDMSDLVIWYEAATTESFKNSEFVNDSKISLWKNIAPETIGTMDLSQTNSVDLIRPIYKTDALDSLPFLYFDGVDDILTSPEIFGYQLAQSNQITVFVVQKYYAGGVNFTFNWDSGSNRIMANLRNNDGSMYWDFGIPTVGDGRIAIAAPINFDNQWKIITLVRKTSATSNSAIRINGTDVYEAYLSKTFNTAASDALDVGGLSRIDVREIIIFKRELTAQEMKDVEKYLSKKWDIDLI